MTHVIAILGALSNGIGVLILGGAVYALIALTADHILTLRNDHTRSTP